MPTPVNWSTEGTLLWEPEPLSPSPPPPSPSSCDWLPSASPFFITRVAFPPGTSFWKTSEKFLDTWRERRGEEEALVSSKTLQCSKEPL